MHASVRRAHKLGLVDADRRPIRAALLELLIHDAIRGGRARERQLAEKHLRKLLGA